MKTTEQSPFENSFFQEAANNKAFFKCALQGASGSGKTYTMAKFAIGLHQKINSKKPVVMIDTETGGKFLKPLFDEAKIKFLIRETRSLADTTKAMKMCQDGYSDILIIDSITHIYENFVESLKVKLGRQRLQFQDFAILKPTWKREFSERLVQDKYHIFFTGRIKDVYENEIDEETGKREIYKSDVTMNAERDLGYEPDVLIYMERMQEILGKNKKIWRQATILKDRSNILDGQTFVNPDFKHIEPIIDAILKDPKEKEYVEMGDDSSLFKTEEDKRAYIKQKEILLEKISNEITKYLPGQSAEVKQKRIELSERAFNTNSWAEIETFSVKSLQEGYTKLQVEIENDKKAEELAVKGKETPVKAKAK